MVVTRRYSFKGPDNATLERKVPTAKMKAQFLTPTYDIEVDDGVPGILEALNEFMGSCGFVHDEAALTTPSAVSPDGSTFKIDVANDGTLSTKKEV